MGGITDYNLSIYYSECNTTLELIIGEKNEVIKYDESQ